MFGEDMRNASGNRLLSFLNEVELMTCNGRKLVSEPEWTRVRPSLNLKSRCLVTGSIRECAFRWYRYSILITF